MSARGGPWRRVPHPDGGLGIAERRLIGTTARVVVTSPASLGEACRVLDVLAARIDQCASRFRADSEVMAIARAGRGHYIVSAELALLLEAALKAARESGGLVDPTVGAALVAAGYDADFDSLGGGSRHTAEARVPGWRSVRLSGRLLSLSEPVLFDLGATGKALLADRAAAEIAKRTSGALVSLGGDVAAAGDPPDGGWPVAVLEGGDALPSEAVVVRLHAGGIATSSTTRRHWRTEVGVAHHIIDPRTGRPATGPWRTASVLAASCEQANLASTAAIVAGERAEDFLAERGLAGRLVDRQGRVSTIGAWRSDPLDDGRAGAPARSGPEGRAA